jgi:hypothetical protein
MRVSLPLVSAKQARPMRLDLLAVPVLGAFLKWRHARLAMQLPLLLIAALVVADGLFGPDVSPMNLAGVLPWIHWRGFLMIGLLVIGNVFCTACPFTLPRTIARPWLPEGFAWPRFLRDKWLAVLLLVLFFWAYEAYALWDSPRWTAWIVLGYFAVALVIDACFRGAAFCKYVCPVGQFNFVQSLVSPFQIRARNGKVCTNCVTKDCTRGNATARGCELGLVLPRKNSNMDCTMCLDCVHACRHDNIGIEGMGIGRSLKPDRTPGLDITALIAVLVFAAFVNAAGMVAPVKDWQRTLGAHFPDLPPIFITTGLYLVGLVAAPVVLVALAASVSHARGERNGSITGNASRFIYALVPIGFAMWLAHYVFHLVTSYEGAIPALQRAAMDVGISALGQPSWIASCCGPVADWIPRLEILVLNGGLLLSLYVAFRLATAKNGRIALALAALSPWAVLLVMLYGAGVWIVLQPMEMRGTLMP